MKKLFIILPIVAVMSACSSNKDPYEKRAVEERERREAQVSKSIDQAPKWMTELPVSSSTSPSKLSAAALAKSSMDSKACLPSR